MEKIHLTKAYQVSGFKPDNKGYKHPKISNAIVIPMKRLQKKAYVLVAGKDIEAVIMTAKLNLFEICLAVK